MALAGKIFPTSNIIATNYKSPIVSEKALLLLHSFQKELKDKIYNLIEESGARMVSEKDMENFIIEALKQYLNKNGKDS